nr:hypothetical protein [Tanacetum cinerariifolium]
DGRFVLLFEVLFWGKGRGFMFGDNLSGKVVEYSLILKTLHEIYDIGSNQLDDNRDDDELVIPFEDDHNVYEFIPSFASV